MDDFKQSRYLRRLALLAAVSCSTTAVYAAESSFRSLIAQGWERNPSAEVAQNPEAATTSDSKHVGEQTFTAETQPAQTLAVRKTDEEQQAAIKGIAPTESTALQAVRESATPAVPSDPVNQNRSIKGTKQNSTGLAELIRSQAKTISVPNNRDMAKTEVSTESEPAPAEVAQQEPIVEHHLIVESESVGLAEQTPASMEVAELTPVGSAFPITVPKSIEERSPLVAQHSTVSPYPTVSPQSVVSLPSTAVSDLAVEPTPEVSQSAESSLIAKSSDSEFDHANSVVPETATQSLIPEPSHTVAEQGGIGSIPLAADNQLDAPIRIERTEIAINEQAVRLREAARQSFENANQRLTRGATHSAKMYAMQTLRSIAAMQDALHGGNHHATQLRAACDAIRESTDFNGTFGTIDPSTLQRMVAVHKTLALKDHNLENLSAIEASEAYLAVARDNLVAASAGAQEASNALVILGKVERALATMNNAHASAVAMTMQDAAVQIAPNSVLAHYELGITQIEQGLVQQAADSLKRSVAIRPTRRGYQKLLQVSRQCGDIDTVQSCLTALKSEHLQTDIPVHLISPERFASTHRPEPASYARSSKKSQGTKSSLAKTDRVDDEPTRVSWRSIIPFGRK